MTGTESSQKEAGFIFFGDVVGRPGRNIVQQKLREIKNRYAPLFVFANGENAAGGFGLTRAIAEELHSTGIDILTLGNHTWDQRGFWDEINTLPYVCRPANFPENCPGNTHVVLEKSGVKIGVFGVLGRTFMNLTLDCPFKAADRLCQQLQSNGVRNIIVDLHAEATSEKYALGWFLASKGVTAVLGTHTHVQTADARLLHQRTAYLTDLGMCGPYESILGFNTLPIIQKFSQGVPNRFEIAAGSTVLNGAYVRFNPDNGQATRIETLQLFQNGR